MSRTPTHSQLPPYKYTYLPGGSLVLFAPTFRVARVDQIAQASTTLEETVQGAAKVLSEAAAITKSAVDAAKKASRRMPPLPTRCGSQSVVDLLYSFPLRKAIHELRNPVENENTSQNPW